MEEQMKNIIKILLLLIFIIPLESKDLEKETILKVGEEKYNYYDLEKAFAKNMNRTGSEMHEISKDSLLDFIELFTNYRLKVNDAKLKGLENDSSVIKDLAQNKKLLSESYIFDKYLTEKYVETTMARRKTEKKIAIIQTSFMEGPLKDTLEAYNKAKEALDRINNGESFSVVAKELSEDPRSADYGGVIPRYVTGGMIARPIEDAIYSINEGEIYPNIVYNRNSYFVIKILDDAERKYVRGSQILIAPAVKGDTIKAMKKADSLLKVLKNGGNFAKLAQKHSDDASTAKQGGDLGEWYSRSTGFGNTEHHVLPEVENAIYKINDGELSDVIRSTIGYHIIRRDSTLLPKDIDDPRGIKVMYKRKYHQDDKESFMDSLAIAYGFGLNLKVLDKFMTRIDTTISTSEKKWDMNINNDMKKQVLFKYLDKEITLGEFIDMLNNAPNMKGTATSRYGIVNAIEKIVHPVVFEKEVKRMEREDKEFSKLMQEFRDGILLFKIEADEVWNNIKFDTLKARDYYDKIDKVYNTDPQYDLAEIYVYKKELADSLYKLAKNGADFSDLAEKYTQRAGFREVKGEWGLLNAKQNVLAEYALNQNAEKGEILEPFKNNSAYSILKVNDYKPVRNKTFEDAIPDFAPEYQEYLQQQLTDNWLSDIRKRVEVEFKKEKLLKIIEQKRN